MLRFFEVLENPSSKKKIFLLILSADVQVYFTLLTLWNLNFPHLLLYNNGSLKLSHHSLKCTHRMNFLIFWFPNLSQISFAENFQVWSCDCNCTMLKKFKFLFRKFLVNCYCAKTNNLLLLFVLYIYTVYYGNSSKKSYISLK